MKIARYEEEEGEEGEEEDKYIGSGNKRGPTTWMMEDSFLVTGDDDGGKATVTGEQEESDRERKEVTNKNEQKEKRLVDLWHSAQGEVEDSSPCDRCDGQCSYTDSFTDLLFDRLLNLL
jgi:hypothetical protein